MIDINDNEAIIKNDEALKWWMLLRENQVEKVPRFYNNGVKMVYEIDFENLEIDLKEPDENGFWETPLEENGLSIIAFNTFDKKAKKYIKSGNVPEVFTRVSFNALDIFAHCVGVKTEKDRGLYFLCIGPKISYEMGCKILSNSYYDELGDLTVTKAQVEEEIREIKKRNGLSHNGIYCIKLDGRIVYIGKTETGFAKRWREHRLGMQRGEGMYLYEQLKGMQDKVEFEIMLDVDDAEISFSSEMISAAEYTLIKEYKPKYNLAGVTMPYIMN